MYLSLQAGFPTNINSCYSASTLPFSIPNGVQDAASYHDNSKLQWEIALAAIDSIKWGECEHVLDIGSGDGKITAYLGKKLPKGSVLGIDISQSMVEFASLNYSQADHSNVSFLQLNATEIDFENQFDRVVSFSALHWVIDQEKALRAIYRSLIPGGAVCIQIYGPGPMNVTQISEDLVHTKKWSPHFPSYSKQRVFFTETEYSALIQAAGFREVSVIGSWCTTYFSDRQALIDFAKPLLNFTLHLSAKLQQEFVEELVDRITSAAALEDDGRIAYRIFTLQALGIK